MSQVSLRAEAGRATGSRESRRLRRTGLVPAIVYGKGTDPINVAVDAHDLHMALHTEAGSNALINLEIEDDKVVLTMARIIERHPFRNEYRHVDFVTVSLDETVHAEVAIHFEGTPAGVIEGGVFSPQRTHVSVETLATTIPSFIELDVSAVEIGDSLRIADLPVLEGVVYTEDPEGVVMSVTTPAAEIEEPEEVEGEEGEELAEGEESDGVAAEGEAEGEPTE
ncbi:MAG TPA: 50S ribosomal protein L25 [Acidimicrobiia bacterium]|jgi:large subunit ribosomal protein L25|nr:50S ribosomal protein L25 [Acidimicrobiia bacterium]